MKTYLSIILIICVTSIFADSKQVSIKYGVSPFSLSRESAELYPGIKQIGILQYSFENSWAIGFEVDRGRYFTFSSDTQDIQFESTRYLVYGVNEKPLLYNISAIMVGGIGVGYFTGSKDKFNNGITIKKQEFINRESLFVTTQVGFKSYFDSINFGIEVIPFDLSIGNLNYNEFTSKIIFSIGII